jgi:hypothetical protein
VGVEDGVTGLPWPGTDLYDLDGRIKSFTIKGIKTASKQYVDSFINSNIAASEIGKVSTAYARFDNSADGNEPFGLAADFIKKLSYKDADGKQKGSDLAGPADVFAMFDGFDPGDVEIRLAT